MPDSTSRPRPGNAALLVAAGRGIRAASVLPKQYVTLCGKPVLRRTVEAFLSHPAIDRVLVVIGDADRDLYDQAMDGLENLPAPVMGGATRQQSVRNGLEILAGDAPDLVLVHDAARPFVSASLISATIAACDDGCGAVPALTLSDTVKRAEAGKITATVPREELVTVQTPQAFPFGSLLKAHRMAANLGRDDLTDDAAVAALAGVSVKIVAGDKANMKLTNPEDFGAAERMLSAGVETRTAQGFDVHTFGPGDSVWLCGIEVPHTHGLVGHSDADVGLHALTDALLGTIGDGDIGQHFPPSDPKWKDASSDRFLADAVRRVAERGGRIVNLDVTLVCEEPKIGPHRQAMQARIADIAGITADRVGVKATTNEGMGFIGRREGMVAFAVATVTLPYGA